MKLNHDNVRSLLLFVEESPTDSSRNEAELSAFAEENGISKDELIYMIERLKEADYIDADITYASNSVFWYGIKTITWKGHEYLDNIRDPKVWKYVKNAASKVSGASLTVLGALAKDTIAKALAGQITLP